MDIRDEYERLKTFAVSKEKWQEIEDLWMIAMDYEKVGNGWRKKFQLPTVSGTGVAGFAIEPLKWRYEVGAEGMLHGQPREDLFKQLVREEVVQTIEKLEKSIITGRLIFPESWKFPLLQLRGFYQANEEAYLKELEEKILELNIALPTSSLSKKFSRR